MMGPEVDTPNQSAGARRFTLAIALVAAVAMYHGWRVFWFMTDDALIAFRYASQSLAGHGYVWNPPPFQPVEGYTSFLWVFLVRHLWACTGWLPTLTANWLSLGFGYLTLFLVVRMVQRIELPEAIERLRPLLLALVLAGTLLNPTFLTWLSSGLETSLFNALLTWWVYLTFFPPLERRPLWLAQLAFAAAMAALTRPDGLLLVAGVGVLAVLVPFGRGQRLRLAEWAALLPLVVVPVHLLWRNAFYGAWLPNTYYAKHVAAWPESGLRYFACFVIENGFWVWILLALCCFAARSVRAPSAAVSSKRQLFRPARIVGASVIGAHLAYYTLSVGGDHFEYRVYSYTVPLIFVSGAWMAARVAGARSAMTAPLLLTLLVAASLPVPWTHWSLTRDLTTRRETSGMVVPVAPALPGFLELPANAFDRMQEWLIDRQVGVRRQEHKVFFEYQASSYPNRPDGSRIPWQERAIYATRTVGTAGWVLPNVAIIDLAGLNDKVISRNPSLVSNVKRQMAHDRRPDPDYIDCFSPNVRIKEREVFLVAGPRTDDDTIRSCERGDWTQASEEGSPTALSEADRPPGRWRPAGGTALGTELDAAQREIIRQLESIGYAAGSREAPPQQGVVLHDSDRAHPGLNFYVSGHAPEAILMDMDGTVVHRWHKEFRDIWPDGGHGPAESDLRFWRRAHLLPNGEILAIHENNAIVKLDKNSEVIWARRLRVHHDLDVTADGEIYVLTRRAHLVPRVSEAEPILEDFVSLLDANGVEKRRFSLLKAFEDAAPAHSWKQASADFRENEGHRRLVQNSNDIFHTNSLAILDGSIADRAPAFEAGNLLVSMCHLDTIAVVDPEAERIVWSLAEFALQHDPSVSERGEIVVFDNHWRDGRSRVVLLDPVSGETEWEFGGSREFPFHSATCGAAESLPNGNILVTESDGGRAFEVTRAKEVVWEFYNPNRAGENDELIATLFHLQRLGPEYSTAWLGEHTRAVSPRGD